MKKIIALLLMLCLVLCGCSAKPAETTAPVTEAPTTEAPTTEAPTEAPTTVPPTEEPTEAPTEPPVPTNPLTGEALEAPHTTRVFAVTINNVPGAMPIYGVSKADLFFEMFVNGYCTRGLALYADISEVSSVGSVRSLRYNFTDLCQVYDAVVLHAGGSNQVLIDRANSGVDNISVESEAANYYFRDEGRYSSGYAWEHCLFVRGAETLAYAESKGIRVTQEEDKDYGLLFTEDGTPEGGEDANRIVINLVHEHALKQTIMQYVADEGKYLFYQYDQAMFDASEYQHIYFENVIVMMCPVYNDSVYHVADLLGEGEGYFACGGKIIPIKWTHENMEDPILFTLADGTPLELGVGNTYVAIAPLTSSVQYE